MERWSSWRSWNLAAGRVELGSNRRRAGLRVAGEEVRTWAHADVSEPMPVDEEHALVPVGFGRSRGYVLRRGDAIVKPLERSEESLTWVGAQLGFFAVLELAALGRVGESLPHADLAVYVGLMVAISLCALLCGARNALGLWLGGLFVLLRLILWVATVVLYGQGLVSLVFRLLVASWIGKHGYRYWELRQHERTAYPGPSTS